MSDNEAGQPLELRVCHLEGVVKELTALVESVVNPKGRPYESVFNPIACESDVGKEELCRRATAEKIRAYFSSTTIRTP